MKTHILLAEDDSDDEMFFTAALREVAPRTVLTVVPTGHQALAYLESSPAPAICVFDINLPGATGIELLGKVRGDKKFSESFVVILTTAADDHTINRCLSLGADAVYLKPDTHEKLIDIVSNIVTRVKQARA